MSSSTTGTLPLGLGRLVPRFGARPRGGDRTTQVLTALAVLLVLLALAAPLLATHDPNQVDLLSAGQDPSKAHWLGTDALGRDLYSRYLYGARLSLLGPALIILFSTIVGVVLALSAAWIGGLYDAVVSRILDILFAFPGLLLAVLAVAAFGQGLMAPVLALSIGYVPYVARIVRSVALRERSLPYISACRLTGMSAWRINLRHLLPNLAPFILAQALAAFGAALLDLATVDFLGLGVQPPTAEWGLMVSEAQSALLAGAPGEALTAGGLIVFAVVVFNLLGDRLVARYQKEGL